MKRFTRGGLFDAQIFLHAETEEDRKVISDKLRQRLDGWSQRLESTPNAFVAARGDCRQVCAEIVSENPDAAATDGTLEALAQDMLAYFDHALKSVEVGDAANAARFAFTAGEKFQLLRLKQYEKAAGVGVKQLPHLKKKRDDQNTRAKAAVEQRREYILALLRETNLTRGALNKWIVRQLAERHEIEISERSVRGDLKALRG
ncbi:MAG: hypothetical protein ACU0AY_15650 [Marinibacterium profundimaris]